MNFIQTKIAKERDRFIEALLSARHKSELSQEEMAKKLNMTLSTYKELEYPATKRGVSFSMLIKLTHILDFPFCFNGKEDISLLQRKLKRAMKTLKHYENSLEGIDKVEARNAINAIRGMGELGSQ
jgi:transcriptional regulator with XRE-family HTH domain